MEIVPYLTERLQGFGTTIFSAMSQLAIETQSVNLGQGFPDSDGPVAVGLRLGDDFFRGYTAEMQSKRDRLVDGLRKARFDVIVPQGTYFVTADIGSMGETDGIDFCMSLPKRCGVVAVPTQVFYDDPEAGRLLVRFAFCKRDEVLDEAIRRLSTLSSRNTLGSTPPGAT